MPYMERVTWGGVALHAGQLPGYPASHGCVRLPMDFAEKLYTVTHKGTTVIVADDIPAGFLQKAREAVTSGTTLILSDLAVSPSTQSKPGFNILTASGASSELGQQSKE
jgi:hypothetical protein